MPSGELTRHVVGFISGGVEGVAVVGLAGFQGVIRGSILAGSGSTGFSFGAYFWLGI